jgi:putative salt-induced outer membrane protein YdiY
MPLAKMLMRFSFTARTTGAVANVVALAVVGAVSATPARADEIVFKNGDRLTGTIVSADGGKLKFKTSATGEITVDLSTVASFSTDNPIDIRLSDGTELKQKIDRVDETGTVHTSGGVLGAQSVPLASVSQINPPPPPVPKWTGSVKASVQLARGNTFTDSIDLGFDAQRRGAKDRTALGAAYAYGRERAEDDDTDTDGKNTTEDNWNAFGKYDYFLTKKFYVFGYLRVEHDRIADLDIRVAPSIGVGYQWVERPDFNVHTELGAGWQYEEYDGEPDGQEHFTARAAYHIDRTWREKYKFFHDLEYLPSVEDADDFNVNANIGLRILVTRKFFTEFSVKWQYDATPAPDAGKNDMEYNVTLGYQF